MRIDYGVQCMDYLHFLKFSKMRNSHYLEFSNFRILKNEKTKSGYTDPEYGLRSLKKSGTSVAHNPARVMNINYLRKNIYLFVSETRQQINLHTD